MTHPASGTLRSRRELALAGAGLILIAGLIHLLLTPQHFAEAAYLGALFRANFAASVLAPSGSTEGSGGAGRSERWLPGTRSWHTSSAGRWGYLAWRRDTC